MEDITNQILDNIGPVDEKPDDKKEEPTQPEQAEAQSTDEPVEEQKVQEEKEETPAQKSWRELRTQAEEGKRTKKQLDEAYRLLNMLEQNIKDQEQEKPREPEEEFNINALPDEEYADNKQLKRILKHQEKRYQKLQKEIENNKKSSYQASVESRVRYEVPDFKDVVSAENVEKLKESRPHIFKSLSYNPDLYEQAMGAYEAIKEFGIYKSNKNTREDYQLQNNLNKPRSAASIGPQKKKSAIDEIGKYNNPSSADLRPFYEDAVKKSGRSLSYNS